MASEGRSELIVREIDEEAEIIVCLEAELTKRLEEVCFPQDFQIQMMPDLSVVIEELSHFNTYIANAMKKRPISALELEIQGEVDKFAVALDFLQQRNEFDLRDQVFSAVFEDFRYAPGLPLSERRRYEDAHLLARNFCRKVLQNAESWNEAQKMFRKFFSDERELKLRGLF